MVSTEQTTLVAEITLDSKISQICVSFPHSLRSTGTAKGLVGQAIRRLKQRLEIQDEPIHKILETDEKGNTIKGFWVFIPQIVQKHNLTPQSLADLLKERFADVGVELIVEQYTDTQTTKIYRRNELD